MPINKACRSARHTIAAATGDSTSSASTPLQTPTPQGDTAPAPKGVFGRIKRFFVGERMDRERLKALGLGAVASYGMLSNLVYCTGTPPLPQPLLTHSCIHQQAWR